MESSATISEHLPWLLSRSLGLSAALMLSFSLAWGLAFSSRLAQTGPGALGRAKQIHQALALAALALIILHPLVLLSDQYLQPSLIELIIPGQFPEQQLAMTFGVLAAWLTIICSAAYYLRRYLGSWWKIIHRAVLLAWLLALAHIILAGSDLTAGFFPLYLLALLLPVIFAVVYRLLPGK